MDAVIFFSITTFHFPVTTSSTPVTVISLFVGAAL